MTGASAQVASTPEAAKCCQEIKTWVKWLMDNHCFSPESFDRPYNSENNIRCYVSCPGTVDGGVGEGHESKNVLRFTPSQRGSRSNNQVVAELIFQVFGGELVRFCHFGTEHSIIERLVEKLQSMKMDLRPIMCGSPIYNTAKHIEKLGLHRELPGLCHRSHDKPEFFMKTAVWKTGGGSIGSEGACVNMWALLTAASLVGCSHIHCKASSRFAQSVLGLILKSAPASATPGDVVPVRSFHEVSKEAEFVSVRCSNRPENFLRPIEDGNFAMNGDFSCCKVVDGKMPEDYLGCGYVREMAKFLKCKYHEVPPQYVYGSYQLMPGRHHAIYSRAKEAWGSLILDEHGAHAFVSNSESITWDFDEWEDRLRESLFLVMPTIWRSGALVKLEDVGEGAVGCLVPDGTRKSMEEQGDEVVEDFFLSNFDHLQICYWARYGEGDDDMKALTVLDTLDCLVVPGSYLWIKPGTTAWDGLSGQFPVSTPSAGEQSERCVRVRLNVPLSAGPTPGKVHVTVLIKGTQARYSQDFKFKHLEVDPWELTSCPPADTKLEIRELVG